MGKHVIAFKSETQVFKTPKINSTTVYDIIKPNYNNF